MSTSPGADLGDAFAAQPMNLVLAIKAIKKLMDRVLIPSANYFDWVFNCVILGTAAVNIQNLHFPGRYLGWN